MPALPTTPVSTPPTPSRKERVVAKLKGFAHTKRQDDASHRGFALTVIVGAIAVIITGLILWIQTRGDMAQYSFVSQASKTLFFAVVLQAIAIALLAYYRWRRWPAWWQGCLVLLLALYALLLQPWLWAAFWGGSAKLWLVAPVAGFVSFWFSMILLFVLVLKLTTPRVDNPELTEAAKESTKAAQAYESAQRESDEAARAANEAKKTEKKRSKQLLEASKELDKVTRERNIVQGDHNKVTTADTTVEVAASALEKARDVVTAAADTLKRHKTELASATQRQLDLPKLIAERQALVDAATAQVNQAKAKVADARTALDDDPSSVVKKVDYDKALNAQAAAERAHTPQQTALQKLLDEEASADAGVRNLAQQVRDDEKAIATSEKSVKVAEVSLEATQKELDEKTPTGEKLVAANKEMARQQKIVDEATQKAKGAREAKSAADAKLKSSSKTATKAQTRHTKAHEAYDELTKREKKTLGRRISVIFVLFVLFVVTITTLYGYVMTQ